MVASSKSRRNGAFPPKIFPDEDGGLFVTNETIARADRQPIEVAEKNVGVVLPGIALVIAIALGAPVVWWLWRRSRLATYQIRRSSAPITASAA